MNITTSAKTTTAMLNDILRLRKWYYFEDGMENIFSVAFELYVKSIPDNALKTIRVVIENNYEEYVGCSGDGDGVDGDDIAEMLIWLGDMDHDETLDARIDIIKSCLNHQDFLVRDAAISALTYADVYEASIYEEALEHETDETLIERLNKLINMIYDAR